MSNHKSTLPPKTRALWFTKDPKIFEAPYEQPLWPCKESGDMVCKVHYGIWGHLMNNHTGPPKIRGIMVDYVPYGLQRHLMNNHKPPPNKNKGSMVYWVP